MVRLNIQLDRYVFVAGSHVIGRIQIKSDNSNFKVEALEVFLLGTEEIPEKSGTTTICDIKESLFTPETNKNHPIFKDNHVQKGSSYVPFSVQIPENLPSSIETSKNKITYRLTGRIKGSKDSVEVSRLVEVYETLTTEEKEKSLVPTKHVLEKFPIREGFAQVTVHTNKTFYPSGDFVLLLFDIDNQSKSKIEGIKVVFVQKRILYLKSKTGAPKEKSSEKILGEKEFKELETQFGGFEKRQVEIIFALPTTHRIKKSPHLEMSFLLRITLQTSGKQPTFDLPLEVLNPLSIIPPPVEWFLNIPLTRRASHVVEEEEELPAPEDEKEKETEKEKEKEKEEEEEPISNIKHQIFPQLPRKSAVALEDFSDPDGITFRKGDTIILFSWFVATWEGKNTMNNTKGPFPKELVQATS